MYVCDFLTYMYTCSPVIVADDANIKVASRRIMWGKCINAGQSCVAPDYILCSPHIKDELVKGFRAAIEQFFGPVSCTTNLVSMLLYIICKVVEK